MRPWKYVVLAIFVISEFVLSAAYFGHLPARNGEYLDAYSAWQKSPTPNNLAALEKAKERFRNSEGHSLKVKKVLLLSNTIITVVISSIIIAGSIRSRRRNDTTKSPT